MLRVERKVREVPVICSGFSFSSFLYGFSKVARSYLLSNAFIFEGEVTFGEETDPILFPGQFLDRGLSGDQEGWLHVVAQRDGRHLGRRKLDGDGIRSTNR